MLYELAQWLSADLKLRTFNVFTYITLRVVLAAMTALAISFIVGPAMIRKLTAYKIGQAVRDDGPQTHLVKYDPDAPLHDRYTQELPLETPAPGLSGDFVNDVTQLNPIPVSAVIASAISDAKSFACAACSVAVTFCAQAEPAGGATIGRGSLLAAVPLAASSPQAASKSGASAIRGSESSRVTVIGSSSSGQGVSSQDSRSDGGAATATTATPPAREP